jgi:hypothetical protein
MKTDMSHPELEFFNKLSCTLEIELTVPTERIGNLCNVRATPGAEITSLRLAATVFARDLGTFRELTLGELQSAAFLASQIALRGVSGGVTLHEAPNGECFTVQDLLNAVAETERQTRGKSTWFGGVDVHHIFFEGVHQADGGVWEIRWGS